MDINGARPRETNSSFAARVGCNYTMASRLRSGNRMPSVYMLVRICSAYELDEGEALRQFAKGPTAFSQWLRDGVFGDLDDATDSAGGDKSHAA